MFIRVRGTNRVLEMKSNEIVGDFRIALRRETNSYRRCLHLSLFLLSIDHWSFLLVIPQRHDQSEHRTSVGEGKECAPLFKFALTPPNDTFEDIKCKNTRTISLGQARTLVDEISNRISINVEIRRIRGKRNVVCNLVTNDRVVNITLFRLFTETSLFFLIKIIPFAFL